MGCPPLYRSVRPRQGGGGGGASQCEAGGNPLIWVWTAALPTHPTGPPLSVPPWARVPWQLPVGVLLRGGQPEHEAPCREGGVMDWGRQRWPPPRPCPAAWEGPRAGKPSFIQAAEVLLASHTHIGGTLGVQTVCHGGRSTSAKGVCHGKAPKPHTNRLRITSSGR